ncbi:hypothetical protein Tco_0249997, partial [Tanacetum coccineum]
SRHHHHHTHLPQPSVVGGGVKRGCGLRRWLLVVGEGPYTTTPIAQPFETHLLVIVVVGRVGDGANGSDGDYW